MRRLCAQSHAEVLGRAREALVREGFGILCEIDVQAKVREKAGKEMPPYVILGACAPALAYEVLRAVPEMGVFLPCNVCVYVDGAGRTVVAAIDPDSLSGLDASPVVADVGRQVRERLARVVAACD